MESLIFLLCLIGLALLLWVWYLICREFYQIAEYKGYSHSKYLWLTFFLGLIGMLLVVALPDRGVQQVITPAEVQPATLSDELPDL